MSVESMLASLQTKPLHVASLKNHVTANIESKKDMNQQLHQIKSKYYELKQKFELVKSKTDLVEHVQKMEDLSAKTFPKEDSEAIESSLSTEKTALKKLNEELRNEKNQLRKLIGTVSADFEKLMEKQKQYNESKTSAEFDQKTMAGWSENKSSYGNCTEQQLKMEDAEQCNEILAGQEEAIMNVTMETQKVDDSLRSFKQQLDMAHTLLEEYKGSIPKDDITPPASEEKDVGMRREQNSKLKATLANMEKMIGTKVSVQETKGGSEIQVTFVNGADSKQACCLSFLLNSDFQSFKSITLQPEGSPVADILASATSMKKFGFVVREIQNRVKNFSSFKKQTAIIKRKYQFIHSTDMGAQQHKLAMNLSGGVECELWVGLDYPMRHARHVKIAKIDDKNRKMSNNVLSEMESKMETWTKQTKGWTLSQWVEKLDETLGLAAATPSCA